MKRNIKNIGEIKPLNSLKELDTKNKKILSILMEDARTPLSRLSKSVELSKSNIIRRVQILQGSGLISGYHAFIDVRMIGLDSCLMLIKTSFTEAERETYVDKLMKVKEIYSIIKITGPYDICLAFYYKTDSHRDLVTESVLKQGKVRDFQVINLNTFFPRLNYVSDIFSNKNSLELEETKSPYNYDSLDIKILVKLSENCRVSLAQLSEQLRTNRETISYRIKKLVENKVIAKFQPTINLFTLGFDSYFLKFKLNKPTMKAAIMKYLASTYRCNTILSTDNSWSLMCFIHFRSNKEFREFEEDMIKKFPDSILEYDFELIKEQYKLEWFPKGLQDYLKLSI